MGCASTPVMMLLFLLFASVVLVSEYVSVVFKLVPLRSEDVDRNP